MNRWICTRLGIAVAGLCLGQLAQAQNPYDRSPHNRSPQHHDPYDDDAFEVLTSGPMHEAFAAPVVFDPEPGEVIPMMPPDPIEEIPPDERPEGDVMWVDGYWGWDDAEREFVWVSGIWRELPPDREWVPGYWRAISGGAQWVAGYWRPIESDVVEYLPAPPQSLEAGPSSDPPTPAHTWVPGVWLWRDARYVWRPGYWVTFQPDWVWVPASYVWTPRGCVFVDGYWDYEVARRGVVFAPVRTRHVLVRRIYRPRVVIDIDIATDYFFASPRARHYYYGDYFAPRFVSIGIYPCFSFHYSRYGYDPVYARKLVVHRRSDPRWEISFRNRYLRLRDHAELRPRRKFVVSRGDTRDRVTIARPFDVVVKDRIGGRRFVKVDDGRRGRVRDYSDDLRDYRRRRIELEGRDDRDGGNARRIELQRSRTQRKHREADKGGATARKLPNRPDTPAPDVDRRPDPRRRSAEPIWRDKRRVDPPDRDRRQVEPQRQRVNPRRDDADRGKRRVEPRGNEADKGRERSPRQKERVDPGKERSRPDRAERDDGRPRPKGRENPKRKEKKPDKP